MNEEWMRAGQAADYLRIAYITLYRYSNEGKIPYQTTPSGQKVYLKSDLDKIIGKAENSQDRNNKRTIAFYLRDSEGNTERLKHQEETLTKAYGIPQKVWKDKASGLNEKRRGLKSMLKSAKKGDFDTLCITAKERLTRFGYTYLEELLHEYGVEILVLDEDPNTKTIQEELLQDFMSLIASFSGKFYKLRSIENAQKLLDRAQEKLEERAHE